MLDNKITEFNFFTEEYLKRQNAQIFIYILIIIKGRYKVYGNPEVLELIKKYSEEKGVDIPDEIVLGNGRTVNNFFLNKIIKESKLNITGDYFCEEYIFETLNELINESIEKILDLYPRKKLLINLIIFASFVSTLSQNQEIDLNKEPENDLEKLIFLVQKVGCTKDDLSTALLGEMKASVNYMINLLLLREERTSAEEIEAEKYFERYGTDYNLLFYWGVIKCIFTSDSNSRYFVKRWNNSKRISFSNNQWGEFPPADLQSKFDEICLYCNKETLGLHKRMSKSIFPKFFNEFKFDPIKIRDSFKRNIQGYTLSYKTLDIIAESDWPEFLKKNQSCGEIGDEGRINESVFLENDIYQLRTSIYNFVNKIEEYNSEVNYLLSDTKNINRIVDMLNKKIYSRIETPDEVKEIFNAFVSKHVRLSKELRLDCSPIDISKFHSFVAEFVSFKRLSIFHKPLLKYKNYYLTSLSLLNEGVWHLPGDILSRRISSHHNINKEITKFYDEQTLPYIKLCLMSKYDFSIINCDLMVNNKSGKPAFPKIKQLLGGDYKGVKRELDILFASDGTLYIYDLKNYGLQHSLDEITRLVNRVDKEISKLEKIKKIFLDNKSIFEEELKVRFDCVEIGIITVNSTIFDFVPSIFDGVYIKSVHNFIMEIGNIN